MSGGGGFWGPILENISQKSTRVREISYATFFLKIARLRARSLLCGLSNTRP